MSTKTATLSVPSSLGKKLNAAAVCRVRLTFAKGSAMRFTSHLDLARTWERALRRADVPLVYSQGFNPRPQIQFAAALPLGYLGKKELLDMTLTERVSLEELSKRIVAVLPDGLSLLQVEEIPLSAPALQAQIQFASYRGYLETSLSLAELQDRVDRFLATPTIPWTRRSRKGKTREVDLRAMVDHLNVRQTRAGRLVLEMRLRHDNKGAGRADEVIAALDLANAVPLIERTGMDFATYSS